MITSYKMQRTFNRINHNKEWNYLHGAVFTRHGIVDVYSQGDDKHIKNTMLTFIHNGRQYNKHIKKRFTVRGLSTVAGRFAWEIVTNHE